MRVRLAPGLAARIVAEARAAFPKECCGLIEGVVGEGRIGAVQLHPTPNLAGEPDRFEIAPEAHFAALRAARGAGRAIIGCYHSHPNGIARPSAHDLAGAGEENFLWLIAALTAPQGPVTLKAFRYSGRHFAESGITGADLVTSSA